jgi:iron complex transport system ATP-binding protein
MQFEILKIEGLTTGYKTKGKSYNVVQQNINITACEGEMIALVGPNGSGKTTLLRTLCRLLPAISGEISYSGKNISKISGTDLARIMSFVSTEIINIENMTVSELVALGRFPHTNWLGRLREEDLLIVTQAMEWTGLQDMKDKNISEISDGERQKALIARALAQDPQVIILDEPTAFLDLVNKYEIINILHDLADRKNKTIIFSVHDVELAIQTSDKLWLAGNDTIFEGAPEDLCLNGNLGKVFNKGNIFFEDTRGEFFFKRKILANISLKGEGPVYNWTKKALERLGLSVSEKIPADFSVVVKSKDKGVKIMMENEESEYNSVYEFADYIKSKIKNLTNG